MDDVTCDITMFKKEPQGDFLQAWLVRSLMEENIKSYILWRLHCLILIDFWYMEGKGAHLKIWQLFILFLDLCENYDTKCQLSHNKTCAVLCLPEYSKMVTPIVNKVHMVYRTLMLDRNVWKATIEGSPDGVGWRQKPLSQILLQLHNTTKQLVISLANPIIAQQNYCSTWQHAFTL